MIFLAKNREAKSVEIPMVAVHQDLIHLSQQQISSSPEFETGGKFLGYIITPGSGPPKSPYGTQMAGIWRQLAAIGYCLLLVGSISPGPKARRTATELLPDGEFQTAVFRHLESIEPTIDHLGTWHSHHPNGLAQFSAGDLAHYRSVIIDKNYGPDFFMAGLCIDKRGLAGGHFEIFGRVDGLHASLAQDRLTVVNGFPSLQPTIDAVEHSIAAGVDDPASLPLESALAERFTIRERQVDSDSVSWVITDRSGSGFLGVVTQATKTGGPVAVSIDVSGQGSTLHYDGPISDEMRDLTGRLMRVVHELEGAGRAAERRK